WVGMWTPTIHDITVGPVNYTDNAKALNNGTNVTVAAPVVATAGAWPAAAAAIMASAGLEPAYRKTATPATVDDDDPPPACAGTWLASGSRGYGDFADNVHYTQTNGDSVSLTFTGTAVSLLGEKSPDQGAIEWLLDGQSKGMVDTSVPAGAPRQVQQVLLSS